MTGQPSEGPAPAGAGTDPACGGSRPGEPRLLVWGETGPAVAADSPLPTLVGLANRLMGAYWWHTAQGLGVSPAGLGVLRLLMAQDGLKSSEVAARGWWAAGTLTSLVDTLVRDGYVERRRDDGDRRVVRLYLTDAGRAKAGLELSEITPRWHDAFDYIDPDDEPVIRRFLVETIERFSKLVQEERGK